MTEQITNEQQAILEGEHNSPIQKEKFFKSLQALLDYANVFRIESAAYGKANVNGQDCYVLQYRAKGD